MTSRRVLFPEGLARGLSPSARELLLEHLDGSHDYGGVPLAVNSRHLTRMALINRGLIRPDTDSLRPQRTLITVEGREVLAALLASYIEVLVRVGYTGYSAPRRADDMGKRIASHLRDIDHLIRP